MVSMDSERGVVSELPDGRFEIRFQRELAHPPARVWRAITDWAELKSWFPAVVDFELTPGAKLRFVPTPFQRERYGLTDADASDGEVTRVDAPRLLEYTWGEEILRWELTPLASGGCRLVFVNVVGDRDTALGAAAGWHAGLEVVVAQLDGREIDWSPHDRVEDIARGYV